MTNNWANQTIWTGDNLEIMRGMNSESVDLIYLDPPFNSKTNYAAPIRIAQIAGGTTGLRSPVQALRTALRATLLEGIGRINPISTEIGQFGGNRPDSTKCRIPEIKAERCFWNLGAV